MGDYTCSVPSCDRRRRARGLCSKHYQRAMRGVDPATPSRKEMTPWQRFWAKVDTAGPCWEWTAGKDWDGYGIFSEGSRSVRAHRWAYQELVGPIQPAKQLDHLCRNRACVNPDHLEQVDPRVNTMRSPISPAAINARKVECPKGHPLAATKGSGRACRACAVIASRVTRGWTVADAISQPAALPPAKRTACPAGHEYTPENTLTPPSGGRHCRTCHREREFRRYHARKRASNASQE